MTEEMFDIIDANNQLTDVQKPRSLVHRENKDWHRVTAIWIVNDKRQVLCQFRSRRKDKDPGVWQANFGGHLKAGQTYIENAIEELKEEIGLNVSPGQLLPLSVGANPVHKHFAQLFILPWNSRLGDLKLSDDEVERVKWLSLEELEAETRAGKFISKIIDQRVRDYIEKNI